VVVREKEAMTLTLILDPNKENKNKKIKRKNLVSKHIITL